MRTVETDLRVRYSETDRMGIVYHAHYIVWFEIGRTEYCRTAGLAYRKMEEDGILILVTAIECRYRKSARYDDPIKIRARMSELSRRGLAFDYEIAGAEGGLLADGSTRHLFADKDGRPKSVSPEILDLFDRFRRS